MSRNSTSTALRSQKGERGLRVGVAPDDLDAAGCGQQSRQPFNREPFIVDEVCAHIVYGPAKAGHYEGTVDAILYR